MKKATACILVFAMIICISGWTASVSSAESKLIKSGDFQYIVQEDGTAAIITADTGSICTIPETIDGYTVTSIGLDYDELEENTDEYSRYCYDIYEEAGFRSLESDRRHGVVSSQCTEVIIPDTVTVIGKQAFGDCRKLESITIPDSVKIIGDRAFTLCDSLTSVTIPDNVSIIRDAALSSCKDIYVSPGNTTFTS